jgi:hypothetical protein
MSFFSNLLLMWRTMNFQALRRAEVAFELFPYSGSLANLAAMRRASPRESSLDAERQPGSFSNPT